MLTEQVISRERALSLGLRTYFTGAPCRHGHIAPRRVSRSNECAECKRIRDAAYGSGRASEKAEYDRAYRDRNRETLKAAKAKSAAENADQARAYQAKYRVDRAADLKAYRQKNGGRRRAQRTAWCQANKARISQSRAAYTAARSGVDLNFKLTIKLRQRLAVAVRSGAKGGSAVRDLGCSIDALKARLESMFEVGMSWDNWGRKGWHIDHVKPLSSFDLTDPEQAKIACHFTNLQPLWWEKNLSKGARLDWPR